VSELARHIQEEHDLRARLATAERERDDWIAEWIAMANERNEVEQELDALSAGGQVALHQFFKAMAENHLLFDKLVDKINALEVPQAAEIDLDELFNLAPLTAAEVERVHNLEADLASLRETYNGVLVDVGETLNEIRELEQDLANANGAYAYLAEKSRGIEADLLSENRALQADNERLREALFRAATEARTEAYRPSTNELVSRCAVCDREFGHENACPFAALSQPQPKEE
jgi:regulator of replication initiation timing